MSGRGGRGKGKGKGRGRGGAHSHQPGKRDLGGEGNRTEMKSASPSEERHEEQHDAAPSTEPLQAHDPIAADAAQHGKDTRSENKGDSQEVAAGSAPLLAAAVEIEISVQEVGGGSNNGTSDRAAAAKGHVDSESPLSLIHI